jgi:hypothetical protein
VAGAVSRLSNITANSVAIMAENHAMWWEQFWAESAIHLPTQGIVEKYWYGSQYLLGCSSRPGKFAPGKES